MGQQPQTPTKHTGKVIAPLNMKRFLSRNTQRSAQTLITTFCTQTFNIIIYYYHLLLSFNSIIILILLFYCRYFNIIILILLLSTQIFNIIYGSTKSEEIMIKNIKKEKNVLLFAIKKKIM